jgi:hypothetical protein
MNREYFVSPGQIRQPEQFRNLYRSTKKIQDMKVEKRIAAFSIEIRTAVKGERKGGGRMTQ